jgi:hypothetical protein
MASGVAEFMAAETEADKSAVVERMVASMALCPESFLRTGAETRVC